MKKMKCLAVMFLATYVQCAASACGNDIIGVYFDDACTTNTVSTPIEPVEVQYWVAVKDMSAESAISAVQFRLEVDGIGVNWVYSLIGAQPLGDMNGDIILGATPSIPANDLILICYAGVIVAGSDDRIEFCIMPTLSPELLLAYATEDYVLHELTPSSGFHDKPVAIINPSAVPTEVKQHSFCKFPGGHHSASMLR